MGSEMCIRDRFSYDFTRVSASGVSSTNAGNVSMAGSSSSALIQNSTQTAVPGYAYSKARLMAHGEADQFSRIMTDPGPTYLQSTNSTAGWANNTYLTAAVHNRVQFIWNADQNFTGGIMNIYRRNRSITYP